MNPFELCELAESCGAIVLPDEVDGPEYVFDSAAFESFAAILLQTGFADGLTHALEVAQGMGGTKDAPTI